VIEKRKVWVAAIAAAAVVAAIIALLVVGGQTLGRHHQAQQREQEHAARAAASASPTPSTPRTPAESFPNPTAYDAVVDAPSSVFAVAKKVGLAASAWDGAQSAQARKTAYAHAGMSAQLASSFTSVWAGVFGHNVTAQITTTLDGQPGINTVTGQPGHRKYVIGVSVIYQGSWTANGKPGKQDPAGATWFVTVDEATKTVTAITQPNPNDLQIRIADK